MIPLVVLDLDGTIIGASGQVDQCVWDAAEAAVEAGVKLAVCTGRPGFGAAQRIAQRLGAGNPHVFQSGAHVGYTDGRTVKVVSLKESDTRQLIEASRRHGVVLELYTPDSLYVERSTPLSQRHAATIGGGSEGILHGSRTMVLQDAYGQVRPTHSISAGLDYPGVGPEHSWLKDTGRVTYVSITDNEALEAFQLSAKLEGIIPALEPSHALGWVTKLAPTLPQDNILVMNMCGRGDKDVFAVAGYLGIKL